jgi:hypothetical protein
VRSFFVIARRSSFTCKGRAVDVSRVGSDLGVRHVVEGSFRPTGARLRLGVQLVEAATGRVIWSQGFEGQREDIVALQDQITAQVAAAIERNLMQADLDLTRAKPTDGLQACELCPRALPHIHRPASRQQAEQTRALSVTCRRQARKITKTCASMRSSVSWTMGWMARHGRQAVRARRRSRPHQPRRRLRGPHDPAAGLQRRSAAQKWVEVGSPAPGVISQSTFIPTLKSFILKDFLSCGLG